MSETERTSPIEAIELALHALSSGPPLGAFGIAREDCALAHMDYFAAVDAAIFHLASVVAQARGKDVTAILSECRVEPVPCDCESCIGVEAATAAREKHRAAYTKVKEWA